jgi:hypothetical protein
MKQADLDILIREGEGVMLEYEESFSHSLARDLATFANSSGGKILLVHVMMERWLGYRTVINCEHKSGILQGTVIHR